MNTDQIAKLKVAYKIETKWKLLIWILTEF